MNELDFILQLQITTEQLIRQLKEAGAAMRRELSQDLETTVNINARGGREVQKLAETLNKEMRELDGTSEKTAKAINKITEAAYFVERAAPGSIDKFRKTLREAGTDTEKLEAALKDMWTGLSEAGKRQQDLVRFRKELESLQRVIERQKKAGDIIGATGVDRNIRSEADRLFSRGRALGVGGFQTRGSAQELSSSINKLVEALRRQAPDAPGRGARREAAKQLAEELVQRKSLIEAEQRAQRESLQAEQAQTREKQRQLKLEERATQLAAAYKGGSAGAGIPSSRTGGPSNPDLLRFLRLQSTSYQEPVNATIQELTQIISRLEKSFQKLENLENQRIRAAESGDKQALEQLDRQVQKQRRDILAQEDVFASRALSGSPRVQAPRMDPATGELLRRSGELVIQGMTQSEARGHLRRFFASSLGGVFDDVVAQARVDAERLRREGRDQEADELGRISFQDVIEGTFDSEAKYAERVAQAMGNAGKNAEQYRKQNELAFKAHKQVEETLKNQRATADVVNIIEKNRAERARRLAGYYRAIRGLSYTIGGFAIGITAGQRIREAFGSSFELEQELAGIQGVLPRRSAADADILRQGIVNVASEYGANIVETAQAARILAQTGLDAQTVMEELDVTMLGMRGVGLTIEQMQELQIAVRAVAGEANALGATAAVLDRISRIEAQFAVTGVNLADAIRLAAPVVNQFAGEMTGLGNAIDVTIGLSTQMIEQLRITGNQAGNALKFIIARLARPEVLAKLQDVFNLELGTEASGGTEFLPLDDLLGEIAAKFEDLDQAQRQQFAVLLAGGRRVNAALTFLEDYNRVVDIARQSSKAFGDVGERTAIQMDTFASQAQVLAENFKILIDQLNRGTGVAGGLRTLIDAMNGVLKLSSGPAGPLVTTLLGATGITAAVGGATSLYGELELNKAIRIAKASGSTWTRDAIADALYRDRAERLLGRQATSDIARTSPGGRLRRPGRVGRFLQGARGVATNPFLITSVVITGLLAVAGALRGFKAALEESDRYLVQRRDLEELGYFDSQQFERLKTSADLLNLGTPQDAVNRTLQAARRGAANAVDPFRPAGAIRGLLQELSQFNTGAIRRQTERGELISRSQLAEAFIAALPEASREAFDELESQAERTSVASRLVAESALVLNASIEDMAENFIEASKTLRADFIEDLNALGEIGSIGKSLSNLVRLGRLSEVQLNRVISRPSTQLPPNLVGPATRSGISPDEIIGQFALLFGAAGENLFEGGGGRALRQELLAAFSNVSEEIYNGATTVREAFDLLFNEIEGTASAAELEDNLVNAIGRTILGERPDLRGRGLEEIFGAGPSATTEARSQAIFDRALERARTVFEEQIRGSDQQATLSSDLDLLFQTLRDPTTRVAIQELQKGIIGIRDRIVEFLVSAGQQIERLQIDENIAGLLNQDFDGTARRLELFTNLFAEFESLRAEVEGSVIKDIVKQFSMREIAERSGSELFRTLMEDLGEEGMGEALGELNLTGQELEERITLVKRSLVDFFDNLQTLGDFLPEDQFLANVMERILGPDADWVDLTSEDLRNFFRESLLELRAAALENVRGAGRFSTITDRRIGILENQRAGLSSIRDPLQALLAGVGIQGQIDTLNFRRQRRNLRADGGLSAEDQEELRTLLAEQAFAIAATFEEFNTNLQTQLSEQVVANVESALSGVRTALSDQNIWADIGSGAEDAFRNLFGTIFDPIAKTFADRIAENITQTLADEVLSNSKLSELFAGPEVRMRNALEVGGSFAAQQALEAHILGAQVLNEQISAAHAREGLRGIGGDQAASLAEINRSALSDQLKFAGATIGGSLVGGQVARQLGRDNRFVGTGSTLGAVAGSFLPGGPLVWGPIGGALGALLGGDREEEQHNEQIRALQAIERAQVSTMETINNQTNELLNPGNRLINLPTSFSVPEFNPGGSIQVNFDMRGVSFNTPQDVDNFANRVEQAVTNALSDGRRTFPRSPRRF